MAKNQPGGRPDLGERMQPRKNKYAAPVGTLFLLLMLIGLISVAVFCVNFTRAMLDNSGEKEEFGRIIAPVLMFDPVPFENAVDADPLFLLQSSMWSALLGEKRDSYQFDNDTNLRLIVPASDIDVACARLFGPEVELHHQTFGDYETTYVYDDESKTYYIPTTMEAGPSPNVLSVVKKGDSYTLEVEYVPPATAWTRADVRQRAAPAPRTNI